MYPRKRKQEATEQIKFILHVNWLHPEVLIFHIPNGGERSKREAAEFKKMGVVSGIPDIFVAKAAKGFHGMYLEMKSDKGKLSMKQKNIQFRLKEEGYKVVNCFGFEEAYKSFKEYIA